MQWKDKGGSSKTNDEKPTLVFHHNKFGSQSYYVERDNKQALVNQLDKIDPVEIKQQTPQIAQTAQISQIPQAA